MKQYLLSIYQPDGPAPARRGARADHAESRRPGTTSCARPAPGSSAPACTRRSTATVVRAAGRRGAGDRRAVHRGQGAPRRLHRHPGRGPRRRAGWAPQAGRRSLEPAADRGPALRVLMPDVRATRSRRCSAPSTAGRSPYWPACSATRPRRGRGTGGVRRRRCEKWPAAGLPPSPAGWIITTARNRAIDRLRRESSREDKHAQAALLHAQDEPVEEGAVRDDRLRLIFTCCHPALALERPGRADPAAARRADHRRDRPRLPGPGADDGAADRPGEGARSATPASRTGSRTRPTCPSGVRGVLAVVYLIFNEGYAASSGDELIRADLCAEAIRLGPAAGRADAGRAGSGRAARADAARRSRAGPPASRPTARWSCSPTRTARRWDRALIAEGQDLVRRCLRRDQPGPYQLQAAINAVHSDAPTAAAPTGGRSSSSTTSCSRSPRPRWSR